MVHLERVEVTVVSECRLVTGVVPGDPGRLRPGVVAREVDVVIEDKRRVEAIDLVRSWLPLGLPNPGASTVR